MRIYSDKITTQDVREAFAWARSEHGADIYLSHDMRTFKARKTVFRQGIEFYAEAISGRYATGHRQIGSYPLDTEPRAAAWDAYGWVIARLFQTDPDAMIGTYAGRDDFIRQVEQATYRREPKDFLSAVRA